MTVEILTYDEEQMTVTYQTSFDTVAGNISFENEALFLEGEEGYKLVWDDSMIFPNLTSTDKVRVSTTQAERGEILDRNGRVLAGKGTAYNFAIIYHPFFYVVVNGNSSLFLYIVYLFS